MVVRDEMYRTGAELDVGQTLRGHYDIVLDQKPEDLYDEFLEYEQDVSVERAVAEYVDEKIPHIGYIAEDRGIGEEELDRQRREAQGGLGKIYISQVWDGEWEDTVAGTCRERAATIHMLYNELGIDSKYHGGGVEEGKRQGHNWVELSDRTVVDPSTEEMMFPKEEGPHTTGKVIVRGAF